MEVENTEVSRRDTDGSTLELNTFFSFTPGDLRRPSFLSSTADSAMKSYGLSSKKIFEGGWVMKKMGVEYMYRRRYIWVDPADLTFHWSKIPDRSSPHKRIKVTDISHVRVVPPFRKIFFQSTTSEGLMWTIELTGDIKIDIMMENLEESNDWIKVLNLACGSRSKSNQQ